MEWDPKCLFIGMKIRVNYNEHLVRVVANRFKKSEKFSLLELGCSGANLSLYSKYCSEFKG